MHSRTATPRLASCLFLAAVCLLLGGNRAAASCGDYVHVRGAGQQPAHSDHQKSPADSPCAHGQCDHGPIAPPAPEPTASTTGGTDAVLATAFTVPSSVGRSYADAEGGPSSRLPSVPFHPPRA